MNPTTFKNTHWNTSNMSISSIEGGSFRLPTFLQISK